MNPREEARKPSNPAREWGMEFVGIVKQIGQPPPTELEEALESIGEGTIRVFKPGDSQSRAIPQEWGGRIMSRVIASLEKASVTASFKAHLGNRVANILTSGLLRFAGEVFLLHEAGIIPQEDIWGIFDPKKSQEVERQAIIRNYPLMGLFHTDEEIEAHFAKMRAWAADFNATYDGDIMTDIPNP